MGCRGNQNGERKQGSYLNGPEKLTVAAIDDDAILLAVADPNVAVCGINGQPMN